MKSFGAYSRLAVVVCGLAISVTESGLAEDAVDYQPLSLTAEAGTLGLGGSLSWRFSDHLGVRGGLNYFSYHHSDKIEGINYDATLRLQSFPLGIDIYLSKSSSFRITAGVLLNQNKLSGSVPPGTTVDINGTAYTTDLTMEAKQQELSPFVTIGGSIYFDSKKHVGLGLELGVAYTGSPDVTLTHSGPANPALDADIKAERAQIEKKAKDYKFYPIVKVGLTISF